MNLIVKESIESFFDTHDVIIDGKNEKTWNLDGVSISLKSDPRKYFVLISPTDGKYDWHIHFENDSDKPYTPEEKFILYSAVADIVKEGDTLTTEGGVTPGGISGIKGLEKYGFKKIGTHSGQLVYWSTTLIDYTKFNKWLINADKEDYIVKDTSKFLTADNTAPIVWVLRKII